MKVINSNTLLLIAIFTGVFNSCKNDTAKHESPTNSFVKSIPNSIKNNNSIIDTSLNDSKVDTDSSNARKDSTRLVGGIKLEPNIGGGYIARNVNGFNYIENFPLILNKQKHQGSQFVEILYYSTPKQLNKRVRIEELNPYLDSYKNIKHGFPVESYTYDMEIQKDYNQSKIEPDSFYTTYGGGYTLDNGYSLICYILIPRYKIYLLKWESAVVVLDQLGDIHYVLKDSGYIVPGTIFDNILVCNYSYNINNPLLSTDGVYRFVNMNTGQIEKEIYPPTSFRTGRVIKLNKDYFRLGYKYKGESADSMVVDIIDIQNKVRHFKVIGRDQLIKVYNEKKIESMLDLLNYFDFKKEKI